MDFDNGGHYILGKTILLSEAYEQASEVFREAESRRNECREREAKEFLEILSYEE